LSNRQALAHALSSIFALLATVLYSFCTAVQGGGRVWSSTGNTAPLLMYTGQANSRLGEAGYGGLKTQDLTHSAVGLADKSWLKVFTDFIVREKYKAADKLK